MTFIIYSVIFTKIAAEGSERRLDAKDDVIIPLFSVYETRNVTFE